MIDQPIPLSPNGQRRREVILAAALRQAGRRRRRRQLTRATIICAALATALPFLLPLMRPRRPAPSVVCVLPEPRRAIGGIVITRIQTEPGIADRLSIPPVPPHWHRLSDDELLRQLQAAGRPAALASIQGHEMLLFHHERVPNN